MGTRKHRRRLRNEREQGHIRFEYERRRNLLAQPGTHGYSIVLDHLKSDFNIGKIFRSADAFGAREVHLVGIEQFNPASAMGSFRWVPARFHNDFASCYQVLKADGYTLFALAPGVQGNLPATPLPSNSAFIFGHEEFGLSFDLTDYADVQTLSIPQFGKVQSLNVSVAASLVMYEYVRQRLAVITEHKQ